VSMSLLNYVLVIGQVVMGRFHSLACGMTKIGVYTLTSCLSFANTASKQK
jgi:hypothetical protein